MLHLPPAAAGVGVVVVTGGPQYRVGSHRQFVMLARHLARQGWAVLRFDCRGMGDSDGEFPGFEQIVPDVAAAVSAMRRHVPTLGKIVLWGLCDATLAICSYARRDPGVAGVALLNPWVRSEMGYARTQLRRYYLERLMQRDSFRRFVRGELDVVASAREVIGKVVLAFGMSKGKRAIDGGAGSPSLEQRMAVDLASYTGRILVILSGRDLTAQEFQQVTRNSKRWQRILGNGRTTNRQIPEADHTFSQRAWCDQVAVWTAEWVRQLAP